MPRRVTQQEYEKLAAFRHALLKFLRYTDEAAQGVGLTPRQHQALLAIKGSPKGKRLTVGDIAERLQIRHHSAVGLANRLVALGYIARRECPDDGRVVWLGLTGAGEEVLEKLTSAHRREMRRLGSELRELLRRFERK